MEDINYINELAKILHTDPEIIISEMSYNEFREWIKGSTLAVLKNLLNLLVEYEMYEYAAIVRDEINNL